MKLIQVVLVMLLFSVSSHLMSLDIGDKAPGFTLEATDGKTYSLDQFLYVQRIPWCPVNLSLAEHYGIFCQAAPCCAACW